MAQQFDEMVYTPEKTTFALFAPADAKSVKLRIYKDGMDGKEEKPVEKESENKPE